MAARPTPGRDAAGGARSRVGGPARRGRPATSPVPPPSLMDILADTVPDYIYFKDREGRYLRINRALADLYGLGDPAEAVGKTDRDFYPAEEAERFRRDELEILRTGTPVVAREERGTHRDGRVAWVATTKMPIRDPGGAIVGIFGISHDITRLKETERALAEKLRLLDTLMDAIPDHIYFKDLQSRFTLVNRAQAAHFRASGPDALIGKTDADYFTPEHAEQALRDEQEVIRTGRPIVAQEEKETLPDGTVHWVSTTKVPLRDPSGAVVGTFGISRDITDRKRAEEQLVRMAFNDPLTGLPNRALLMDRLGHRLGRARRRPGGPFAVLFLDLDRFKGVNDSLGHEAGDALLVAAARRLEACLRPGDTVARLGGDEFTILLEEIAGPGDALRIAERIQQAMAAAIPVGGTEVFTTASVGIAFGPGEYASAEEILRDADLAMYRAKANGRARYEVFDKSMHEQAVTLLHRETELRRALERGELRVVYQPIVALDDRRILGFEALVRWQHPREGLLAPDAFLAVAEETGLIGPIGFWVIREACTQLRVWQARFPADPRLRMHVNVSNRQLLQKGFVEQLRWTLETIGLDPRDLTLEVTEGAILENIKSTAAVLSQVRALSVQLHVENFGPDGSCFAPLHRIPAGAMKVDRAFVSRLQAASGEEAEIVRTVIRLARSLGMTVSAEGVETEEQLALVRALDCGSAQGFLFSEPLAPEAAEALLARGPRIDERLSS